MSYEELSREELIEALEQMEQQLDNVEQERNEFEKLAKRTKPTSKTTKKNRMNERKKWQTEAERKLAKDLISVIDNFERALMAADEDSSIYQGV